jgi:hypothetical protein
MLPQKGKSLRLLFEEDRVLAGLSFVRAGRDFSAALGIAQFFGKDCHVTTCRRRGSKDLRLLLMRIGYSF